MVIRSCTISCSGDSRSWVRTNTSQSWVLASCSNHAMPKRVRRFRCARIGIVTSRRPIASIRISNRLRVQFNPPPISSIHAPPAHPCAATNASGTVRRFATSVRCAALDTRQEATGVGGCMVCLAQPDELADLCLGGATAVAVRAGHRNQPSFAFPALQRLDRDTKEFCSFTGTHGAFHEHYCNYRVL